MSHRSCARQVRARRAVSLLTAGLLTAAVACTEPTRPTRTLNPETATLAAGGNQNVKVRIFRLSTNTLRIEGPSVPGDASIFNPGLAIPAGVSMQAVVTQGAATREAANAPLACSGTPGDAGKLPTGTCDILFDARASNLTSGSGSLVSGPAVLVLRVIANATELASKSINVNLVGSPGITALSLAATTLLIDGPGTDYTATLVNPANSLQNVLLQGWIVQGSTRRESDRTPVDCGSSMGVFPPGSCTITSRAPVSASAPGVGTLVPGAATFELQLIQRTGGTSTTLGTRTVAITLVSGLPTITSITPATSNVILDAATAVSVNIANPGPAISTIIVQGYVRQGAALRGAGGRTLTCGPALGTLPNGGCVQEQFIVASNSNGGGGTLVPGSATYEVELIHFNGTVSTILDTKSIPITLVAPTPPTIVSITPASSYVVLDKIGWVNSISVTISNPGAPLSNVLTQGYIRQGTALRGAGGANLSCDGPLTGNLPNGECVEERRISAFNANGGTGTLAPGDATFELELIHFDGSVSTILDTKSIPITLVANIPSIVSVSPASTSLVIDGPSINYTATLYNPSGAPLDGVLIRSSVDQISTASSMPAGDVVLSCTGTSGEMPTGACVVSFTVGAANSAQGSGALVPGEAYIRMELRRNGALIWTTLVPVTLTSP